MKVKYNTAVGAVLLLWLLCPKGRLLCCSSFQGLCLRSGAASRFPGQESQPCPRAPGRQKLVPPPPQPPASAQLAAQLAAQLGWLQ